jgi:hypothetical protein
VAEDQRPKQKELDRESRRLAKLRNLRLVERPPEKIAVRAYTEYEPKDAA